VLALPDEPVLAHLFRGEYDVANYVASNVAQRRKGRVVLIGEIVRDDLIRAELRISREDHRDLRKWMAEAKRRSMVLGGGGHRSAVGARLQPSRWPEFVGLVRNLALE